MQVANSYLNHKPYLWLWLPLGFLLLVTLAEFTLPDEILSAINNENGLIELLQAALTAGGFILAIIILWKSRKTCSWPLKLWIGLAALCCLYVTGEEVSWGQHFFNWEASESWKHINDQQETNLHNTSSWLDQKPRLLLLIGVIVGGLLIPLAQQFKPHILPEHLQMIYPEKHLWVTSAIALLIKITDKIGDATDNAFFERASELEETYLFYFVLLYLLIMKHRLTAQN